MRIVHVAPTYAPCIGGAERLLQAVSERLAARGHAITVLTFNCATQGDLNGPAGAGLPETELLNGVKIVRVNPAGGRLERMHQWWLRRRGGWRSTRWLLGEDFEFYCGPPSGLGMMQPLLALRPELVASVNWHFGSAYWTLQASRWRGIPHVAVPILHIDRPWAARPAFVRMLPRCDATIVCTEAERAFVEARRAVAVAVAGAGVDAARFDRPDGAVIRERYGLGSRPVVGFVGRQDESKGVGILLDAMQRVWERLPQAVLLLAGPSAHRDRVIDCRLRALPAPDGERVVLVDDFSDQDGPSIMAACDLLAQPSIEEAFGLVLVEAWMCERPVIGADIAATRSLIEPGVDGWLVPPGDANMLSDRILDLLSDPARRAEFGRSGRAKVLAKYTWDRVASVWESTFRKVLQGAGQRT